MKSTVIWLIVISLIFLIFSCKPSSNKTRIEGNIKNGKDSLILVTYVDHKDSVYIDKDNKFSIDLNISQPIWVKLIFQENAVCLYVQPGAKIELNSNLTDFDNSIKISGSSEEIENYLLEQNNYFYNHVCNNPSYKYETAITDYLESLADLEKQLQNNYDKFFAAYGEKYRHFADNEKLRLQFMVASLKLDYSKFVDYSDELGDGQKETYYDFLGKLNLNNTENENIIEFNPFASIYVDWKANNEASKADSEIFTDSDYINTVFDIIQHEFKNNRTIEYLYYVKLNDFLMYYGIDNLEAAYKEFMKISQNQNYKSTIKSLYDKWQSLTKGKTAPAFTCKDIDGKPHTIDEFKGKLVVIDVWASWCGPCLREIPYMEKLKKTYAKKPVEFIAISVDDSREEWVEELESSKLTGNQWFAAGWNNPLCNNYIINSIPRFMVIDAEGKIININAPNPSGDLSQLIDSWLIENTKKK